MLGEYPVLELCLSRDTGIGFVTTMRRNITSWSVVPESRLCTVVRADFIRLLMTSLSSPSDRLSYTP